MFAGAELVALRQLGETCSSDYLQPSAFFRGQGSRNLIPFLPLDQEMHSPVWWVSALLMKPQQG